MDFNGYSTGKEYSKNKDEKASDTGGNCDKNAAEGQFHIKEYISEHRNGEKKY